MSLNETLDRLAREREQRENLIPSISGELKPQMSDNAKITELAERIFFQRMLKDINPGMSEPKIEQMIDRSVMIASKLFNRLYKQKQ